MKSLLVLFLMLLALSGHSQYAYSTGKSALVRREGFYKLSGWHFDPGVTWMGTRFRNSGDDLYSSGDTTYTATHDPGGRIGFYFGVGRYKIFKYARLFPYMDYGIAYKGLRGKESYEGEWRVAGQENAFATTEGAGNFAHHNILAYVNFNNILQISNKMFLQNSLGANIDYSIIMNSDDISGPFRTDETIPRFWAQIHYKLGLGFKFRERFFLIPTIETPLVNFSPWTNFKLKMPKYMSEYRPLILTIRFAWTCQNNTSCPPVYDDANGPKDDPNYR